MIPINVDRNVGPSAFDPLHLAVTSIFYTFQGEGPFAGRPAVFIRLAGCDIGRKEDCKFCDTYFALDDAKLVSPRDVAERAFRAWPADSGSRRRLYVITGGEPLLQYEALHTMLTHLRAISAEHAYGADVQVETNGHYLRLGNYLEDVLYVVSPKVPARSGRYQPLTPFIAALCRQGYAYVKLIVTADPSSPYHIVPAYAHEEDVRDRVYLSPMTDYTGSPSTMPDRPVSIFDLSPEAVRLTRANIQHATRLALLYNFKLSFQTHLFAGVA